MTKVILNSLFFLYLPYIVALSLVNNDLTGMVPSEISLLKALGTYARVEMEDEMDALVRLHLQ